MRRTRLFAIMGSLKRILSMDIRKEKNRLWTLDKYTARNAEPG